MDSGPNGRNGVRTPDAQPRPTAGASVVTGNPADDVPEEGDGGTAAVEVVDLVKRYPRAPVDSLAGVSFRVTAR